MSQAQPPSVEPQDLGDTLYDPGPKGLVDAPAPDETLAGGPRTTILPKIRLKAERPELAHEHRTRYEIVGEIGKGGEGEVLKAIDHDIGRLVALKRMRGHRVTTHSIVRFVEEIRTTGRLEHPNIIPVHDVGIDEDNNYYFIMKYIDGETLESIIKRLAEGDPEYHARFSFERRVAIFRDLCEAIAYAHSKGYIHRDIKPANVMIGAFGEVVLMDWGIAKRTSAPAEEELGLGALDLIIEGDKEDDRVFETQSGVVVGTPAYMAPEQALGQPLDERSDVYSLCVLLHEFITLEHYLAGEKTLIKTLMGVTTKPVPAAAFTPVRPEQGRVPADISWFIIDGVGKDPDERYGSVQEMLDRLGRREAGDIPTQCAITGLKHNISKAERFVDNHPLGAAGILLLACAGVIASLSAHVYYLVF